MINPIGNFYLARLTRLAGNKLEIALEKRVAGVMTSLASMTVAALDALADFDLAAQARGQNLELKLSGRTRRAIWTSSV